MATTRKTRRRRRPTTRATDAIRIPPGETRYVVDLDEETVEQLSHGICSEALAQRMHRRLDWKREQLRVAARTRAATRSQVRPRRRRT